MSFSEIKEIIQSIKPNIKVIDVSIPARDCPKFGVLLENKSEDDNLCLIAIRDGKNNQAFEILHESSSTGITHSLHYLGNMNGLKLAKTIEQQSLKLIITKLFLLRSEPECPICMEITDEHAACIYCTYNMCFKCFDQIDKCPQCRENLG